MKIDTLDYDALDPGIRTLVRWLRKHGFQTCDSGDGISKGADGEDFAHVYIIVDQKHLLSSYADYLRNLLKNIGVTAGSIQAQYSPDDGVPIIILRDLDDLMLPKDLKVDEC